MYIKSTTIAGRYFSMHLSEPVEPVVERKNVVRNENNYVSKRELNAKYSAFLETLLRAALYEKMVTRKRRLPVLQQKQQRDGASYEQVLLGNLYL